jgi:flagellar hook-associated protein 1 FlgK
MASDLISIARSGAQTARTALDVTAQNIANAGTAGYVRRSVQVSEVVAGAPITMARDISLSGSRVDGIVRNADAFRLSEVRRTGADAARASAEVTGLEAIEAAVEQSGVYDAVVAFEATLQQLAGNPVDLSLRAAAVESARGMAGAFDVAATALGAAGEGLRFEAQDGAAQVNTLSGELARVNQRLSRATGGSSSQNALLDERDRLLEKLSGFTGISATIAPDQSVEVRLGGPAGPALVSGGTAAPFAMAAAGDGTISFTLAGAAVTPTSGSLAGKGQALGKLRDIAAGLDTIAATVIATVNAAQAGGVALDGSAGQPLFSGTGAGDMTVALTDGAKLATAPAGAGANSRDPANLAALREALAAGDPAAALDTLLVDISSAVQGRSVTREALGVIADTAKAALQAQAGVDLDNEAVNLVRFQQAFQANGRVMQIATELFDTLLGIR